MDLPSGLRLSGWKRPRAWAWLLVFPLLLNLDQGAFSQQEDAATVEKRIARDRKTISEAERLQLNNGEVGRLWAEIASGEEDLGHFEQAESAYAHALEIFGRDPSLQIAYAVTLDNLGTLYALTKRGDASLDCRKRVLEIFQRSGNLLRAARAESHLADAYLALGKNKDAERHALLADRELSALPDATREDRASALVGYAFASCLSGHCAEGIIAARKAMSLAREALPPESFAIGQVHVALGYTEWRTGDIARAEGDLREGIRILRLRLPPSHPLVVQGLEIYRWYLSDLDRRCENKKSC
jgi:tetratricopeptide (TPR) repeat protein